MTRSCVLIDKPDHPALAVYEVTSIEELPRVVGAAFQAVGGHLSSLGEVPAGPPFVGYLSEGPDYEVMIGYPTARELPGAGPVVTCTIPRGRRAVTMHVGPYDRLGETYDELMKWVADQGERPGGPVFEFYLNSPVSSPPQELQTRIELLLA